MTLRWFATAPIFFTGIRAFNTGDYVPDDLVTGHGLAAGGRVVQVDVPAQNPAVITRPLTAADRDTDAEREAFIPSRLAPDKILTAAQVAADPALRAAFVPAAQLATNPDMLIAGTITRDANGTATAAPVAWPDGDPGQYTATTVSTAFPGAVDAYTITKGSPVKLTFRQPAVTRDANGAVTQRPALVVA